MADIDLLLLAQVIDSGRDAWDSLHDQGIGLNHFEGRGSAVFEWVSNRLEAGGSYPSLDDTAAKFDLTWPRLDGYSYRKLVTSIRDRRIARIIEDSQESIRLALSTGNVAQAERAWQQVNDDITAERNGGIAYHSLVALGQDVLDRYEATKADNGPGLCTPWESVNRMMGKRLLPGSVLGMVARPSVGKTTVSLSISTREWKINGKTLLYVSPEMAKVDLAESFFAFASKISFKSMVMGSLSESEEARLRETARSLKDQSGFHVIDSDDGLTPERIVSVANRLKPDVIVVDSFYELFDYMNGHGDMQKRLDYTTAWLKKLAAGEPGRRPACPVVANSQLKRGVEAAKAGDDSIGMSDRIMQRFQAVFKLWRNDPEDQQNGIVRIGPLKVRRAGDVKPEVKLQWRDSDLVEMDPPRRYFDDSQF